MKTITISILVIVSCLRLDGGDDPKEFKSYNRYQGKIYELTLMQSEMEKAPIWNEKDPNPPLSVRDALKIGKDYVAKLVPKSENWLVSSVILARFGSREGQWMYTVQFAMYDGKAPLLGGGHEFKVPVLFDGTTPKAEIKEEKR